MENVEKAAEQRRREAFGLAAKDSSGVLSPFTFSRRMLVYEYVDNGNLDHWLHGDAGNVSPLSCETRMNIILGTAKGINGDNDVTIKILYCGICHTDLHGIKNEWNFTVYPIVPGHEIVGIVTDAGSNVHKLKVGDRVGVGCLVGCCRSCEKCSQHKENYCPRLVFAYSSIDTDGSISRGGYSNMIVIDEHFAVKFPENFPLDRGAPLLCAGITVYSPMKKFGLNQPGKHIGVAGLGGLGHVAVKFGKAFGMKVTVISTSPGKEEEAIKLLGADAFLVSSDADQMQSAKGTMDGIINTVSAKHALLPLILLLKSEGTMIIVGAPERPLDLPALPLLLEGKILAGSCIGGMKETQEMIDFAGKHNIAADIELIAADYVNQAMERLAKGDVRYRFVIDVGNTLASAQETMV